MEIHYRYDTTQALERENLATPADASEALRDGNRRFVDLVDRVRAEVFGGGDGEPIVTTVHPLSLGISAVAGQPPAQKPFGIILGCSDARVPIERIFDQSHNELFVVRVAGNVLGTECLGSIEYASRHFGDSLRLVGVLGHSACGAVGAAVDIYLNPATCGATVKTHALRTIVDRLLVVVRAADKALKRRGKPGLSADPGYRLALWQMAVYLNAAMTSHDIALELDFLKDANLEVVYGVYDLVTQKVGCSPGDDATFGPAPKNVDEINDLGDRLADAVLGHALLV